MTTLERERLDILISSTEKSIERLKRRLDYLQKRYPGECQINNELAAHFSSLIKE